MALREIGFKLRQAYYRLEGSVRNIPFVLKLKWLSFKYKGAANIPPAELPVIIEADDDGQFFKVIKACSYLESICTHFKVESSETRVWQFIGQYVHGRCPDEETSQWTHALINSQPLNVAIWKALLAEKDIAPRKVAFFAPPAPFENTLEWVKSLK